ncbi:MAG: ABC transporter substrate-binding protein [Reyranella sp.]|nr:ABC transporter substrate-binding protein [Reyranella sp.]
MRRRELLISVGAAAVWPTVGRAQRGIGARRVGVLLAAEASDPQYRKRLKAFGQTLAQRGWVEGQNLQIEVRWGEGQAELTRKHAVELATATPDVILASGNATITPLLQVTRKIPVVFAVAADPVGSGYVQSLAKPGGNATGFMQFEYALSGKWLELLVQIAPRVKRVAVLRDNAGGVAQFAVIQSLASSLGIEVSPIDMQDAAEIERTVSAFAGTGNGGLIVTASAFANVHRELIIALAKKNNLPTVYFAHYFATDGGLISYGTDLVDQFRQAATYVDRILRGEAPADLPVQAPTNFELAINLKTAAALGLTIPATILSLADEVIE